MKILFKGAVAVGLMFTVASCSSDSKSSDTTTAVSAAPTTVAGADTTVASSTADSTETSTGDSVSADGSVKDQIVAEIVAEVTSEGGVVDEACVKTAVDKLSDADAQAILTAGVTGDPDVSADGTAIAAQVAACLSGPTSTP